MAYVFDLSVDVDEAFTDALGTEIYEFVLGFDLEKDLAILMSVMLFPTGENTCDLRFGIRERDLTKAWKISGVDYSQETVKACIPPDERDGVLDFLTKSVEVLIDYTKYEKITMQSYDANLPAKAMLKYLSIVSVLENKGFQTDDHFRLTEDGKDYWLFSKVPVVDPA